MKPSTLFLFVGGSGCFAAGFWLAQLPGSATSLDAASPMPQPGLAAPAATARPSRHELLVPSRARDWRSLLAEIEPEDVPRVIEAALEIRDEQLRASVLPRLLHIWATEAPDAAFNWISRQKHLPWLDLNGFFRAWAERDPAAAVAHLAAVPKRSSRWEAAAGIASAWAAADPTAAIAWAKQLPAAESRGAAIGEICRHFAERDPQQAVEFVLSLGEPAAVATRLNGIVRIQAATDPQAALQTINNLPADVPRGPLCRQIVDALVAEDPKLAGEFALTIPPSEAQRGALQSVASRLAVDSVQTALDWINSTIPSGPIRGNVMENTLVIAAQANPKAVAPIAATLRGNLFRNVAMNLAINWVRSDPQATTAWVDQLPADRNRALIQRILFTSWSCADPAAAAAWLATTDLPQETKQQLLSEPR
ncbi:MAG TPA: hypothetical protein VK178_01340 [Opitutaceae bacterium]|nr:hypothetical protein [Opitutaceae bacterium]